jgi:glycosyltransferase involved in cell wall biosynthesis
VSSGVGGVPRVLHVIDSLKRGGAERFMTALVGELSRRGQAECIVRVAYSDAADPHLLEDLEKHALDFDIVGASALYDPRLVGRLIESALRFQVAVIHSQLVISNVNARVAALATRKPHVSTIQTPPGPSVEDPWRRAIADGITARLSTRIVAVSPQVAAEYGRAFRIPPSRLRVIPNVPVEPPPQDGPQRERARELLTDGETGAWVVLCAARLTREKAIKDLISAAALLRGRLPELRVVIAGDGPERDRLREQIATSGLGETVRMIGQRTDIGALLTGADVFCLPSRHEGLPVSVLEAMQAGAPCVATAVGGTPEIVKDGETGLLVPASAPPRLADAIERLHADRKLAQRLAEKGRRLVERHYTASRIADQYAELYRQLAATGRRV